MGAVFVWALPVPPAATCIDTRVVFEYDVGRVASRVMVPILERILAVPYDVVSENDVMNWIPAFGFYTSTRLSLSRYIIYTSTRLKGG